jgi:aspartate kinase
MSYEPGKRPMGPALPSRAAHRASGKITTPHSCLRAQRPRILRVLKFGGTSVGNAVSILKVVDIVRRAAAEGDIVVVVSAMSGVTNKLVEAGRQSEIGNRERVKELLHQVRSQHEIAAECLLSDQVTRHRLASLVNDLIGRCAQWCDSTSAQAHLTPAMQDLISSLGERLAAPLVAAALVDRGLDATEMEATHLVATDSQHGSANPRMNVTSQLCESRLLPLIERGVIPVVTCFI